MDSHIFGKIPTRSVTLWEHFQPTTILLSLGSSIQASEVFFADIPVCRRSKTRTTTRCRFPKPLRKYQHATKRSSCRGGSPSGNRMDKHRSNLHIASRGGCFHHPQSRTGCYKVCKLQGGLSIRLPDGLPPRQDDRLV